MVSELQNVDNRVHLLLTTVHNFTRDLQRFQLNLTPKRWSQERITTLKALKTHSLWFPRSFSYS